MFKCIKLPNFSPICLSTLSKTPSYTLNNSYKNTKKKYDIKCVYSKCYNPNLCNTVGICFFYYGLRFDNKSSTNQSPKLDMKQFRSYSTMHYNIKCISPPCKDREKCNNNRRCYNHNDYDNNDDDIFNPINPVNPVNPTSPIYFAEDNKLVIKKIYQLYEPYESSSDCSSSFGSLSSSSNED